MKRLGSVPNPLPKDLPQEASIAARLFRRFADPVNGLDQVIPAELLQRAKGFAFLTVVKAGFLFSGRAGFGCVIARLPDGEWSGPSAIGTAGAGFGMQAGAEITEFFIVLNSRAAVKSFMTPGSLTLGGNISIAAGPMGRNFEGSGSVSAGGGVAAMYSYSKTQGLFGGASLEGSLIAARNDSNESAYGARLSPKDILTGQVERPEWADTLVDAIRSFVQDASLDRVPTIGEDDINDNDTTDDANVFLENSRAQSRPSQGRSRKDIENSLLAYDNADVDFDHTHAPGPAQPKRKAAPPQRPPPPKTKSAAALDPFGSDASDDDDLVKTKPHKPYAPYKPGAGRRQVSSSSSPPKKSLVDYDSDELEAEFVRRKMERTRISKPDYSNASKNHAADSDLDDDAFDPSERTPLPAAVRTLHMRRDELTPYERSIMDNDPAIKALSPYQRKELPASKGYSQASSKPHQHRNAHNYAFRSPAPASKSSGRARSGSSPWDADLDTGNATWLKAPAAAPRSNRGIADDGAGIGKAIALYSFRSQQSGDLAFQKGDVITLLSKVSDQWWRGSLGFEEGIFPYNYVEVHLND